MNIRIPRWPLLLAALAIGVTSCQEELTTPGSCPATCPGGTPVVRDTVLDAVFKGDSSYTGYLPRGAGAAGLRVSNGFLSDTDYAFIKFDSLPLTVAVGDTTFSYVIDSAAIEIPLLARDTTASGVMLTLHRLPITLDTSAAFADIDPYIVPGTLIDSVTIADSIRAPRTLRFVFQGDTLDNIAIPPADSGVLSLAVAMTAPTATGVRIGGAGSSGLNPLFKVWVTVDTPDTTTSVKKQFFARGVTITRSLPSSPTPFDPDLLTIGTQDAARTLIRFPWPAYLRDSAVLARATLELTPDSPIEGLPGDTVSAELTGITADFGAKSPPTGLRGRRLLTFGSSDTVRIDVIAEVQFWQTGVLAIPHPPALMVRIYPDGGSFTEPRFRSTRSAGGHPRLRVTYQLPFDFERP